MVYKLAGIFPNSVSASRAAAPRSGTRHNTPHPREEMEIAVPTGKVKFFDEKKGFGFISGDDGVEVYLPESSVPIGARLRPGTRVEYGVGDTRRGPAALQVSVIEKPKSLAASARRSPEELRPMIEDLIKILDAASEQLRHGRYPKDGPRIATALRALAEDFDVE